MLKLENERLRKELDEIREDFRELRKELEELKRCPETCERVSPSRQQQGSSGLSPEEWKRVMEQIDLMMDAKLNSWAEKFSPLSGNTSSVGE